MESKDTYLPGENIAKEPCNPQVPLQDIPQPSGTCPQPGIVAMTEPSPFVHVGPPGPVPGPMSTTLQSPQLLQSSVKDSLTLPPPPSELYENFLLRTGRSQPVHEDSVPPVTQNVVIPNLSTSVTARQGLSPLPVPFPTYGACPGIGQQIKASSVPPGRRMPLPRYLYIPPMLAWQWSGCDAGQSPVTGLP